MQIDPLIGMVGAVALNGSSLFQIIKFIRSKEIAGVSISFWWVVLFGLCCCLRYAISINDLLFILSNLSGMILTIVAIFLYYYYKFKPKRKRVCRFG